MVGVGVGVFWAEADTFVVAGCAVDEFVFGGPISPLYTSPSSPDANESVEQNPSDEDITRVSPSLDLILVSNDHFALEVWSGCSYQARSVNVAQCRLLTTQIGVFCWVSYRRTESWVATAYTIRYSRENAGFGPGVAEPVSLLVGVAPLASAGTDEGGGGGSMTERLGVGFVTGSTGSGRARIGSSADEVSMVM